MSASTPWLPGNWPASVREAVQGVFEAHPPEQALTELVVSGPVSSEASKAVAEATQSPALRKRPLARAALWLYVDELDHSHDISQKRSDSTGSFLHGIMHRREGDYWNSHYWMNQTSHHPVWAKISDYDPHAFIDAVERGTPEDLPALIEKQREEWRELFNFLIRVEEAHLAE